MAAPVPVLKLDLKTNVADILNASVCDKQLLQKIVKSVRTRWLSS